MWCNCTPVELQSRNQSKFTELGILLWYQLNPLGNQSLVTRLRQDNFVARLEHAILQIDVYPHGEGEECNIVNDKHNYFYPCTVCTRVMRLCPSVYMCVCRQKTRLFASYRSKISTKTLSAASPLHL